MASNPLALNSRIASVTSRSRVDTGAARLLRDESPAITRMLTESSDTIAIEVGADALAALLTEVLPLASIVREVAGRC